MVKRPVELSIRGRLGGCGGGDVNKTGRRGKGDSLKSPSFAQSCSFQKDAPRKCTFQNAKALERCIRDEGQRTDVSPGVVLQNKEKSSGDAKLSLHEVVQLSNGPDVLVDEGVGTRQDRQSRPLKPKDVNEMTHDDS